MTAEFKADEGADVPGVSSELTVDEDDLDLDLSEFDMDLSDSPSPVASSFESTDDSDDLDLELSDFDMPSEEGSTAENTAANAELELDETFVANEDAGLTSSAPQADEPQTEQVNSDAAIDVEDIVFDEFDAGEDDTEGFDSLIDGESVATKLDLARAYIDMGDSEGAREMLEEVLHEGDAQQQSDAQALLDNIG